VFVPAHPELVEGHTTKIEYNQPDFFTISVILLLKKQVNGYTIFYPVCYLFISEEYEKRFRIESDFQG
jgi:hypothetical protein